MFDRTAAKVKAGAKAAAYSAGAMMMFAVAAAFLTVSGWAALSPFYSTSVVALIIGGVYLGFAFVLMAVARSTAAHPVEPPHPVQPSAQDLSTAIMNSFLVGMSAGQGAAKRP